MVGKFAFFSDYYKVEQMEILEEEEFITFQRYQENDFEFYSGEGFAEFNATGMCFVGNSDEHSIEAGKYLDISQNFPGRTENCDVSFPDLSFVNFEDNSIDSMDETDFEDTSTNLRSEFDFIIGQDFDFVCLNFLLTDGSSNRKRDGKNRTKLKTSPSSVENVRFRDQIPKIPIIQQIKYEQQGNETWNKANTCFKIDVKQISKYYNSQGECLLCGNKYWSSHTAKRHIKLSHLKLREFVCPKCPSVCFQEHKGLKDHLKKFHPECEILDLRKIKNVREIQTGKIYLDGEHSKDPEECSVFSPKVRSCGVKVSEIILLECQLCDEKFNVSSGLKAHMSKAHSNAGKKSRNNSYNRVVIKQEPGVINHPDLAKFQKSFRKRSIKQEPIPESIAVLRNQHLAEYHEQQQTMALLKNLIMDLKQDQIHNTPSPFTNHLNQDITGEFVETSTEIDPFGSDMDTDGDFMQVQNHFIPDPATPEEDGDFLEVSFNPPVIEFMASTPIAKKHEGMKHRLTKQQKKNKKNKFKNKAKAPATAGMKNRIRIQQKKNEKVKLKVKAQVLAPALTEPKVLVMTQALTETKNPVMAPALTDTKVPFMADSKTPDTVPFLTDNKTLVKAPALKGTLLSNPIECTKCRAVLTNFTDFNFHLKEHWKMDKTCAMCNCAKSSQANLLAHVRIHSGEAPYSCNSCHHSFKQKGQLMVHAKIKCQNMKEPTSAEICTSKTKSKIANKKGRKSRQRKM